MNHILICSVWLSYACLSASSVWTSMPIEGAEGGERLFPLSDNEWWLASGTDVLLRTQNGGISWRTVKIHPGGIEIVAMHFVDSRTGWAAGADKGAAVIMRTDDGGSSWKESYREPRAKSVFIDIRFSEDVGLAVGRVEIEGKSVALALISRDRGRNWTVTGIDQPQDICFRRVRFDRHGDGWAVGGRRVYSMRRDSGDWKVSYEAANGAAELNGLATVGDRLFVSGGWGLVLRSENHGKSWQQVGPAAAREVYLWSVAFQDERRGWVCGDHGQVYGTIDAGNTWVEERRGGPFLRDVEVSKQRAIVTGDRGVVAVRSLNQK